MISSILILAASNDSGVYYGTGPSFGWESALTLLLWVAAFGALVVVQRWAFARRDRGEEASTSRGEGAEAIIPWNS